MKERFKKIIEPILGYGLIAIIIIAIISIIAIFAGALMRIFGFQYKSVGSIILYFIIMTVVDFPIDTLITAFLKALTSMGRINVKGKKFLSIVLGTISTGIVMSAVDYYMDSVSATDLSILVISFIMSILSLDKEEKNLIT